MCSPIKSVGRKILKISQPLKKQMLLEKNSSITLKLKTEKITHFMNAFFQINVLVEKLHLINKNVAPNKLVLEGKILKN